jgi:hypothetical protein
VEEKRPWRTWTKPVKPHPSTLRLWRVRATKLAKEAGFAGACNLCKRPYADEERYGSVVLRPAKAWRGRATRRKICNGCYITLQAMLEELEWLGARDHLPPERDETQMDAGGNAPANNRDE